MSNKLQKIGLALALTLPFTTKVMAQCPSINSLNLSIGSHGKIYATTNLSSTTSSTAYFTYDISRTNFQSSFPTADYDSSPIIVANSATLSPYSNGNFQVRAIYKDTINACLDTIMGAISIFTAGDTISTCNRFVGNSTIASSSGGINYVNTHILLSYRGACSPATTITPIVPSCVSYTTIALGVYEFESDTTCSYAGFKFVLSDPTNTICPSDTLSYYPSTSCKVHALFTMAPDNTSPGTYIVYNNSAYSYNYFNPTSTATLSYVWNFGDGSTSAQEFPTHTYASAGFYNVSLTVTETDSTGNICSDTQSMIGGFKMSASGKMEKIVVKNPHATTGINEKEFISQLKAYPNPIENELTIEMNVNNTTSLSYSITDALGKVISQNKLTDTETVINTSSFNTGFYVLSILNEKGNVLRSSKLVK